MLLFVKQDDGTFTQTGEVTTKHGTFHWMKENGNWSTSIDGSGAIEPIQDLLDRMHREDSPYKYQQYCIREATKPPLDINPCCTSCGVPGDTTKPVSYEQAKNWRGQSNDWSEGEDYTAFFGVATGQIEVCCDYNISKTSTNTSHAHPSDFKVNEWGQIVALGRTFCSVFCLAQELVRRKKITKREMDTDRVREVLGMKPVEIRVVKKGGTRCANLACGNARDERGNRVRALVPAKGDFCSKGCKKTSKQALEQSQKSQIAA